MAVADTAAWPAALGLPFQGWFFLLGSLILLFINYWGLVGLTIKGCMSLLIHELKRHRYDEQGDEDYRRLLAEHIELQKTRLIARRPFGCTIGVIEQEFYLYSLCVQRYELLCSILMFKAFTAWLGNIHSGSAQQPVTCDEQVAQQVNMLAQFYAYAIGNFISLGMVVVLFEILRGTIQRSEMLQNLILIK